MAESPYRKPSPLPEEPELPSSASLTAREDLEAEPAVVVLTDEGTVRKERPFIAGVIGAVLGLVLTCAIVKRLVAEYPWLLVGFASLVIVAFAGLFPVARAIYEHRPPR